MKGYIRYVANIFGNFANYEINTKNTMEIMMKLQEYSVVPSVMKEMQIQITDNKPMQIIVDRIQLNSPSHGLLVSILENNIVIEAQPLFDYEQKVSIINSKKFIADVKNIYKILLELLGEKGNRISLVSTYLNDEKNKSEYNNYIKDNKIFYSDDAIEWSKRQVIRKNVNLSGKEEEINIITNILMSQGTLTSSISQPPFLAFNGVIYEIDINTIPENTHSRIDINFMDSFYDIAEKLKEEIKEGLNYE